MAMEGVTTSGAFTGAILAEKLTKLNVTQQSIENVRLCINAFILELKRREDVYQRKASKNFDILDTLIFAIGPKSEVVDTWRRSVDYCQLQCKYGEKALSHWCIFHRKKAREIVETWAKKFQGAPREQGVPFLYLANDILQNSRRKGPEFVNEFWTVLPRVLRDNIVNSGDEAVKNAAYRLVDIWEERRVFGCRPQGLREELLGKKPQPPLHEARHNSNIPSHQMVEGSMLERVTRSYRAVQEKSADEHSTVSKYYAAVSQIESLEKEAEGGAGNGGGHASKADELLEQQSVVRQCIEQLEGFEISHALLCTYLKDFLVEQERNLEQVRTHLQIAKAQLEHGGRIQHRLTSPKSKNKPLYSNAAEHHKDNNGRMAAALSSGKLVATSPSESSPQATSVAAEVAAKLTANSSSAAVLTSVLSSLAGEEGPQEKRPRMESRQAEVIPDIQGGLYSLPPPMPPYLTSSAAPLPYAYQFTLRPPPTPAAYQPFQASSMQPYYSQPPLPAPPAPAPRQ